MGKGGGIFPKGPVILEEGGWDDLVMEWGFGYNLVDELADVLLILKLELSTLEILLIQQNIQKLNL